MEKNDGKIVARFPPLRCSLIFSIVSYTNTNKVDLPRGTRKNSECSDSGS